MEISIIIRDLPYLKILHPVCLELHKLGVEYNLYHWDAPRGEKAYNNASLANIKKSSPEVIKHANKVQVFSNDKQLRQYLLRDKASKLVSVEIALWGKPYTKFFRDHKIRPYSVLYLSDSIWGNSTKEMHKVYYTTKHLMETHHKFSGVQYNKSRDRAFGSPIFDCLAQSSSGDDILVLLPNLRQEHVGISFGSLDNFVKMIAKLSEGGDLIFKSRKKQWLPNEIRQYAKRIVYDGDKMYPSTTSELLKQSCTTVMFYSSGIYECVYAGNYVVNIPFSIKRWGWDKQKLRQYFSTEQNNLYQFDGVVESIGQKEILSDGWKFVPRKIDMTKQSEWIKRFVGVSKNSAKLIAEDIVRG